MCLIWGGAALFPGPSEAPAPDASDPTRIYGGDAQSPAPGVGGVSGNSDGPGEVTS